MPCTTILVGKKATYDGSTMMARNEDSGAGHFMPKKWIIVNPEDQPRHYVSVLSGVEIDLPEDPLRYNAVPNAVPDAGVWGESGFNSCNVAMSETETITSNARVLGADPLVKEGIGEEDMLTITLPYIRSAREGVLRLGALLEKYGTYEMNGIGFQDQEEIWWLESIGGHNWIAKKVPDDCYAVIPNQQGIDDFDFSDACGEGKEHMCSNGLPELIERFHLDLVCDETPIRERKHFDVRAALGSHTDHDHTYNTPRAWVMEKLLNPTTFVWEGEDADFTPFSDDLPWCLVPEKKITPEEVKEVLSNVYQGTPYDPYGPQAERKDRLKLRPIGINRNNFVMLTQLRKDLPDPLKAVEWIAMGSNAFNAFVPFYAAVKDTPAYLRDTGAKVDTGSLYWASRLIGALADSEYHLCAADVDWYQKQMAAFAESHLAKTDRSFLETQPENAEEFLEKANRAAAEAAREMTDEALGRVLHVVSNCMKNAFSRSDG